LAKSLISRLLDPQNAFSSRNEDRFDCPF